MPCTHPYVEYYFDLIDSGRLIVCKEQHLLKKFLQEKVLCRDDIYMDKEMVDNSVKIPERYFPYKLFPWEKFLNCFIFGLRWKDTNDLVFNRYFIFMGRGGGKNGFLSWNSFFMMTKQHGIEHYNIEIVATSEDQAKQSFTDVKDVLESDKNKKKLKNAFYRSEKLIKSNSTKSKMRYNTSNARTKDGKRPGCVIFDEEHEYDNYKSIKVFTSAGGKIQDYREFHTSTDGNVRGGPLDDLKEQSRMILNGEIPLEDVTLFPFVCKIDSPEEADEPTNWQKANPSLPYNHTLMRKMKQEYQQGKVSAPIRVEFMTKRMNSPVEDTRFEAASYEDRLATKQDIPEEFNSAEVIGGVDFADVRDFCSVGCLGKNNGKTVWLQHTFIHYSALELQDINPDIINLAMEKGNAEIVYGKSIDPDKVVKWFLEQAQHYYIKKIAMDTYRATILKPKLEEAGFEVEVVRTGNFTHSKLSPLVDDLFINQNIVFGDDPLMRWYVGNVYVEFLSNGNKEYRKIDKEKRKTDGFFAFLHALNFYDEIEDSGEFDLGDFNFNPIVV